MIRAHSATEPRRLPGKPPYYFIAAILAMKALDRWLPLAKHSGELTEAAGAVALVAGIGVAVWAVIVFGQNRTTIRPLGNPSRIVTRGPYRFTRNPMYLGLVLVLAGIALDAGSLSPWAVVPVFIWVITRGFIRPEEQMLAAKFPDAYPEYQARVRRWV